MRVRRYKICSVYIRSLDAYKQRKAKKTPKVWGGGGGGGAGLIHVYMVQCVQTPIKSPQWEPSVGKKCLSTSSKNQEQYSKPIFSPQLALKQGSGCRIFYCICKVGKGLGVLVLITMACPDDL